MYPAASAHKARQMPVSALGFTGSQEKAESCTNKMIAL
jgi:hypothetical protein